MTSTYTYTYTVADVRKVMDQVRADLRMAAESSGALSTGAADLLMGDIAKYAEKDYISEILIRLVDGGGLALRAAQYSISTDAATWSASRAGNMMWPQIAGARIKILLTTNAKFGALGQAGQDAFEQTLSGPWPNSTETPSLAHLSGVADRNYVSNAYGVKKTSYS